jgi:hypothetical protein
MISSLFCDVTQRRLVVSHRSFGTTYRSHIQGSSGPRRSLSALPLKMGQIGIQKRRYITTNQRCTISQKSEDLIYRAAEA